MQISPKSEEQQQFFGYTRKCLMEKWVFFGFFSVLQKIVVFKGIKKLIIAWEIRMCVSKKKIIDGQPLSNNIPLDITQQPLK